MSSSSLPLRTSHDGSTAINSSASPMPTTDRDDVSYVPLLSNLQLNDRMHSEGDSPLRAGSSTSELTDSCTTIDDLPDELMVKIFSYVSFSESIVLQEVSKRWKFLAQDAHLWHNQKYVVGWKTSEEEAVATFAAKPQLRTVILEKVVSPGVFEVLSRSCPHLTTLEMSCEQMLTYSEADKLFDRCRKIRTLTISDYGLRADVRFLDAVVRLADLRVLHLLQSNNINYWEEVEIPLRGLADCCPHLCDLYLGNTYGQCYRIRDAEYFVNSHKCILKSLCIRWTSVEGRCIIPLLLRVETLENLELLNQAQETMGLEEATEAFTALGQLHSLRQLEFRANSSEFQHLVPAVFGNGGLLNLQQLSVGGYLVDETTRAVAEHCLLLRELKLMQCEGHTDALFEPLHLLKKLEILKIFAAHCLYGKAMSHIAKLPALHTLEFYLISFDNLEPIVDGILEISGLRRLCFYDCTIFAMRFDKFPGRLVNLRELVIDGCDGFQEVLDRLCAQMPELKVQAQLRWDPYRDPSRCRNSGENNYHIFPQIKRWLNRKKKCPKFLCRLIRR